MAIGNVDLYVDGGSFSAPYYRFYTDSSGQEELTNLSLDTGSSYTFRRLGDIAAEKTLVVVDAGLEQLEVLLGGLAANTQVLTIGRSTLALPLITDALKKGNFDRLSIVAHGSPGSIQLGRVPIPSTVIETSSPSLNILGGSQ